MEKIAIISPASIKPDSLVKRLIKFVSRTSILECSHLSNLGTHFDLNATKNTTAHIFSPLNSSFHKAFVIKEFPVLYANDFTVCWLAKLLLDMGGLTGLHQAPMEVLCERRGIGPAKAAQLKAAIELGRRLSIASPEERPVIQSPEDAATLLLYEMGVLEQEHLRLLLLDTRNRLIRTVEVYRGSLNSSAIRIGEIFREAIRANAAALIVAHNHPSGDPTPSPEDVRVTAALVEAGGLLDIEVLDHIVIGKNCYVSLKSKGLGFN